MSGWTDQDARLAAAKTLVAWANGLRPCVHCGETDLEQPCAATSGEHVLDDLGQEEETAWERYADWDEDAA